MVNTNIAEKINMRSLFNDVHKCAALFLIDTSQSVKLYSTDMASAVKEMLETVAADEVCQERMDIGIMTFNKRTELLRPISPISPDDDFDYSFECRGRTSIGTAVFDALAEIQKRIDYYHESYEEEPYVPKLIIITDAKPLPPDSETDAERERLEKAYTELHDMVAQREIYVMTVGVGENLDNDNLKKLNGGDVSGDPFTIGSEMDEIKKLFKALGTSITLAAQTGDMLSNNSFQEQLDDIDPDFEEDWDDETVSGSDRSFDAYASTDDCPLF